MQKTETQINQKSKILSDDYISSFSVVKSGPIYDGSRTQNLLLMKALSIKPGWSNNAKWPDGTDVDDYSIVDWIKYGKGKAVGISSNDASKEARSYLYDKYVKSK